MIINDILREDKEKLPSKLLERALNGEKGPLFEIGRIYEKGLIIKKNDEKAYRIFKICSDNGVIEAKIRLAEKLFRGEGIKKNNKEAKVLLEKLILDSNIKAMVLMGDILCSEQKYMDALELYEKAHKEYIINSQDIDAYYMAITYNEMVKLLLDKINGNFCLEKAEYFMDEALKEDVFCNAKLVADELLKADKDKNKEKAKFYYERIAKEKICTECIGGCNKYCENQLKMLNKEI